jgi:hypothetical protein
MLHTTTVVQMLKRNIHLDDIHCVWLFVLVRRDQPQQPTKCQALTKKNKTNSINAPLHIVAWQLIAS